MRIAMWSGPRNLSTAMMYAFASRTDCAVVDEPFYAAYLRATGTVHPMQEAILAAQPQDYEQVIRDCLGPIPDNHPHFYQKHMTQHMLPDTRLDWLHDLTNVFLIRHPARVVASYLKKRHAPTLDDIGFRQQLSLFEYVKTNGQMPIVIDSDDILSDPQGMLRALCRAIGLPFQASMLRWPKGGHPADGVWAPHWYASVWNSDGLTTCPAAPLPEIPASSEYLVQQALPYYNAMAVCKIHNASN